MKCDPLPGNSLFPGSLESSLTNRDRTREVTCGKGKVQKVSFSSVRTGSSPVFTENT